MADLIERAVPSDLASDAAAADVAMLPACLPTPLPAARPVAQLSQLSSRTSSRRSGEPSALEAMRQRQAGVDIAVRTLSSSTVSTNCAEPANFGEGAADKVLPAANTSSLRVARPDVFGSVALKVSHSPLEHKWQAVQRARFNGTTGPWADLVTKVSKMDRQQLVAEVNRWVNARVSFADDTATVHEADQWSDAARTLRSGRGDCEDYAIAKMRLLEVAGVDPSDMFLVVARDLARQADHAILIVRENERLVVLDNGTDKVLESAEVRDYRPIMSFNAKGMWLHGFAAPQPATPTDAFRSEQLAMAR